MKPVDQTVFGVPGGNCFSACVASLLEISIDDVPYFMDADSWFDAFNEWLRPRGLYAFVMTLSGMPRAELAKHIPGYVIVGGQSGRGSHAIVGLGGRNVHDPHPSRAMLDIEEDVTILVPFEPHR